MDTSVVDSGEPIVSNAAVLLTPMTVDDTVFVGRKVTL